jgi:hypothetical protein
MSPARILARAWLASAVLWLCSGFAASSATVTLLPAQQGGTGHDLVVPIVVDPADGVSAMDFLFSYDPLVLQATGVFLTAYTDGFTLVSDLATPGQVGASLSFGGPLAGSGEVAWVVFRVLGATGTSSALTWLNCTLNAGAIPSDCVDGAISVVSRAATMSVPDDLVAVPAASLVVPIALVPATGAVGVDITLEYNPAVLTAVAVTKTSLTSGMSLTANLGIPGTVRISLYGTAPLSGSGPIVEVTFIASDVIGREAPLNLTQGTINEGTIPTHLDDGGVSVCDPVDRDADGLAECSGDCAPSDGAVYPGAAEICDGKDNDCDGSVDDADPDLVGTTYFPDADGDGYGAATGSIEACTPPAPPPDWRTVGGDCDDGDPTEFPGQVWYADCDADGYERSSAVTACDQAGADAQSPCADGLPPDGGWSHAVGDDCDDEDARRYPTNVETCNGLDDDCDAASADGSEDPGVGVACDGPDGDLCVEGATVCTAGALECSDATGDTPDLCNGLDDDCDAASADGSEDPGIGIACDGPDGDLCLEGATVCTAGLLECSDATGDTPDLCNGLDDDCDAASADGSEDPGIGIACDGPDGDLCVEGATVCTVGALECSDATGDTPDICNGLDDDCDAASADGSEDPGVGVACDGADGDLCLEGATVCTTGALECSDATGDTPDICNGLDDDCDAASADGSEDPGVGIACDGPDGDLCVEGATVCTVGALECSDATGDTPDLCNGLDDDCDAASADGSEDPGVGIACDGPDGDLCVEGATVCTAGALECSDATGDTPDICNGLDDDCDAASTDGSEDPGVGVACDGPDGDLCVEGATVCTAGLLECSDATGDTPDICNGLDDDCDAASADGSEDPGVGVACDGPDGDLCAEGATVCTAGLLECSDATGDTPDICNGLDDDCDAASADGSEDPGVGVACDGPDGDLCVEGTSVCAAGSVLCDDATGDSVELCNLLDDDCDTVIDDGFDVGAACTRGAGACERAGTTVCAVDGLSAVCDAVPGLPSPETCNGVDDDCDTIVDNPPVPVGPMQLLVDRGVTVTFVEWYPVSGATGYDLVRGLTTQLSSSAGDYAVSTQRCLASDQAATAYIETDSPDSGESFWYLVRPRNCGGAGSYDEPTGGQVGSRDAGIAASPNACP